MANQIRRLKYKYKYTKKKRIIEGTLELDLGRFEGQYSKAQYELDSMVMTSMIPFMPKQAGLFINMTQGMSQAIAGSGTVVAAAPPMGRFLYEGKVMVGERTRSAFAEKGERKIVTDRNLKYSRPKATDHWFDAAKKADGKEWVKKTKKLAGGG